jgi:hypothetical protein
MTITLSLFRTVVAIEPSGQSIETWKELPLSDITLIQFSPDLPFEMGWNDDLTTQLRMACDPAVESQ